MNLYIIANSVLGKFKSSLLQFMCETLFIWSVSMHSILIYSLVIAVYNSITIRILLQDQITKHISVAQFQYSSLT